MLRRVAVLFAVLAGCLAVAPSSPALAAGTSHFVDCSATANGNGSKASPWNDLATVSHRTFLPGDELLFKRGTTCRGSFVFTSSGTSRSRIRIGAYGTGPLPVINGTGQRRAVKLLNTSYVTMEALEVKNSRVWGVLVTTDHDAPAVGITLRDLRVHHVTGAEYHEMKAKWTGLVVFAPGIIVEPNLSDKDSAVYTRNSYFDRVVVDNVTAYDTTLWAGIFVWGVQIDQDQQWAEHAVDPARQSRHIKIQNSTVHDTFGDGIGVFMSRSAQIKNNVVYQSGLQDVPKTIGNPIGLHWWSSSGVTGQFNESYSNRSPGPEGGGYAVDFWSSNSRLQYNYGHDNGGYCVGAYGYSGETRYNIVRYNICAGNGTQHTYTDWNGVTRVRPGQSEIYLCTWVQGKLVDTWIYNNTFYVNSTGPPSATGLFDTCADGDVETNGMFKNNLVISTIPTVLGDVAAANNRDRDYNLYYYTGGSFSDPRREPHGIYNRDPLVNRLGYHGIGRPTTQWTLQPGSPAINGGTRVCAGRTHCGPGKRDFFGNPIKRGGAFDIGAHEAG